ncbi:MAG: LysM peptidoglycan-binding domain-containing protein [Caldilineaceae bacterium]|nr:LysM peptidoglycan-binding domain-containing protein [Caldilineaceae bacterium]
MATDICKRRLLQLLLIFLPVMLPISVYAQDGGDAFSQMDGNRQTVAMAINQMRAQAGLPPLAVNPLLNQAAQNHVNDMIANYNYSHTGSDGSNVRQRVQRTGYAASPWVSENWVSVNDPSMAIQWWMNSYVHRNNILNGNWHELGVGGGYQASNSQFIFVAVFAAGESGDSVVVMPPEPEPLPIPAGGMQYQIQPGDTLLSIGLRYGVEWPMIAGASGLSEYSLLQIGQVIRIPGVENVGGYVGEQIQAASAAQPVVYTEPQDSNTFIRRYTVQQGDTLDRIAAIYDISWQELARENGLGEYSVLTVGKELRIPGAVQRKATDSTTDSTDEPTTTVQSAAQTVREHVVRPGDTIISIALQYDMDWHDLLQLNHLTESTVLQLGQAVRLR